MGWATTTLATRVVAHDNNAAALSTSQLFNGMFLGSQSSQNSKCKHSWQISFLASALIIHSLTQLLELYKVFVLCAQLCSP